MRQRSSKRRDRSAPPGRQARNAGRPPTPPRRPRAARSTPSTSTSQRPSSPGRRRRTSHARGAAGRVPLHLAVHRQQTAERVGGRGEAQRPFECRLLKLLQTLDRLRHRRRPEHVRRLNPPLEVVRPPPNPAQRAVPKPLLGCDHRVLRAARIPQLSRDAPPVERQSFVVTRPLEHCPRFLPDRPTFVGRECANGHHVDHRAHRRRHCAHHGLCCSTRVLEQSASLFELARLPHHDNEVRCQREPSLALGAEERRCATEQRTARVEVAAVQSCRPRRRDGPLPVARSASSESSGASSAR